VDIEIVGFVRDSKYSSVRELRLVPLAGGYVPARVCLVRDACER
jgi:hypothetical protein